MCSCKNHKKNTTTVFSDNSKVKSETITVKYKSVLIDKTVKSLTKLVNLN